MAPRMSSAVRLPRVPSGEYWVNWVTTWFQVGVVTSGWPSASRAFITSAS